MKVHDDMKKLIIEHLESITKIQEKVAIVYNIMGTIAGYNNGSLSDLDRHLNSTFSNGDMDAIVNSGQFATLVDVFVSSSRKPYKPNDNYDRVEDFCSNEIATKPISEYQKGRADVAQEIIQVLEEKNAQKNS